MGAEDYNRFYRLKVTDPGTWPNLGAPEALVPKSAEAVVDAWVEGADANAGLIIQGGSAPARESLGIEVVRRLKETSPEPVEGFVWSEMDFSENYRTLRSLEDFAKKERDPETWNLYVEYERKFHRLMSREVVFFQGLMEYGTVSKFYREHMYHEVVRRLTQTQYDSPRLTVVSTPSVSLFRDEFLPVYEYFSTYATLVDLDGER